MDASLALISFFTPTHPHRKSLSLLARVGGGWGVLGGWTKTKLMLFSTQVEVVVELKLELSLAMRVLLDISTNLPAPQI